MGTTGRRPRPRGAIRAASGVSVTVPALAEEAGAILMDVLGPFEEEQAGRRQAAPDEVTLVFYPAAARRAGARHRCRLEVAPRR